MPWSPLLPTAPPLLAVPGWFAVLIMSAAGAIPSAEAFGTVLVGPPGVLPTGIPSAQALGNPTVRYIQNVVPTGIGSAAAFGNPSVLPGVATINVGTGIPSAGAVGTPTVGRGPVFAAPTGIASAEAFGAPALTTGPVTVTATGIPSGQAFGAATVTAPPPSQNIVSSGIASAEAVGTPTVGRGTVLLLVSGIASGEAFGTATVARVVVPVSFDSVGAGNGASGNSVSWSHTIGAGADALVVAIQGNGPTPTSVKVGSTNLTKLGELLNYYTYLGAYQMSVWIYGMIAPPTGVQTITATWGATSFKEGNSMAYNNVGSFGTAVTNTGSGTAASQAVPSAVGQMVAQVFGDSAYAFSAYNQTQRYLKNFANNVNWTMVAGDAPGAATVNFSANIATSSGWGAIGVPLIPA